MRIGLINWDYTFYVSRDQLIDLIYKGSKLETTLLDQKFTIEKVINVENADGIDIHYLPEGSGLSNAMHVSIKASLVVLDKAIRGESVNTKYNGKNYLFIRRD